MEYTLLHPFTFDDKQIEKLEVRRPKVRDIKKANRIKDNLDKTLTMVSGLTGLSMAAVEDIDAEDLTEISKIVAEMTGTDAEAGN